LPAVFIEVIQIMVTRRTDARRRRVLSEEFVPTDETAVAGNRGPMKAYSFGANRRNQPKTTDLIPKRATALGLFLLFLASCVAGLNVLAINSKHLVDVIGESGARSVALFGPGTLANWLCCVCLLLCAGICTQLYLLRQHRRDDYGGMYRVWILMALMFVVASIDCAVDLRSVSAKLFEYLTQRSLMQTPWLMLTIEMIVLAIIVIRMLFEVRASRFSLAAVLLVWLGFVGCIVLRNVPLPASMASIDPNMAYGNFVLLGCFGSLIALTVYARFVFLHAHGLIQMKVKTAKPAKQPVKEAQPAAKVTSSSKSKPESKSKHDAGTTPKSKAKPKTKTAPTPTLAVAPQSKAASTPAPAASTKKKQKPKQKVPAPPAAAVQPEANKQNTQSTPVVEDPPETISMSKSERRRARKLAKRAAREKKAA
jgi:hypothetical protein